MKPNYLLLFFFNLIGIFWFKIRIVEGIIGGYEAQPGQFKYQVSIVTDNVHTCGGSIIGDKHILSAAHCFINYHSLDFTNLEWTVIAGVVNVFDQTSTKVQVKVKKIHVPKEYRPLNFDEEFNQNYIVADIAVLELETSLNVETNSALSILNLPPSSESVATYDDITPVLTGYGHNTMTYTRNRFNGMSVVLTTNGVKLKYGETKIMSYTECQQRYNAPVRQSHICAQMKESDHILPAGACNGDSGGPLVHMGNLVIGVLNSGAVECNETEFPSIYAKVASYTEFISTILTGRLMPNTRTAEYRETNTIFFKNKALVEITPI